ncbi:MAG: bacteriophage Gp15 family protein [Clostridia bacterium]|nr:bacteriophage Gp15 family protein [Clostridia bacterium]
MDANILLTPLPESVTIDGEEYFINADFRVGIMFEKILADETKSSQEKVTEWLAMYYLDGIPQDTKKAADAIINFYSCGVKKPHTAKRKMNGNVEIKPRLIYSYEYDASYIFGAFLSQYGIDLNDIEFLHWWKFQALFKSLHSSNKIVEIMGYRSADLSKITNKKERERIAKLKEVYAIPENLTHEEKVARAGAAFGGFM